MVKLKHRINNYAGWLMTHYFIHRSMPSPVLTILTLLGALVLTVGVGGCANYRHNAPLYQRNVALQNQNTALRTRLRRQKAALADLQAQLAAKTPRIATLSPHRLAALFTVSAIRITSDTAVAHLHGAKKYNGFRVFVRTLMPGNLVLPATGTFTIEAFDLGAAPGSLRLGRWVFTPRQVKKLWYGNFGLNEFCFNCPWKKTPVNHAITFHVTFKDALTGHLFTDQRVIKIAGP
ncbi:MAG: hypothetical protein ACP5I8_09690 [Phycisphaerae bacterium]